MPKLSALSEALPKEKAALVAWCRYESEGALRFMKKMGATYDSLIDPSGGCSDVQSSWDAYNLVIDQDGKVVLLAGFSRDEAKLEREVASLYDK